MRRHGCTSSRPTSTTTPMRGDTDRQITHRSPDRWLAKSRAASRALVTDACQRARCNVKIPYTGQISTVSCLEPACWLEQPNQRHEAAGGGALEWSWAAEPLGRPWRSRTCHHGRCRSVRASATLRVPFAGFPICSAQIAQKLSVARLEGFHMSTEELGSGHR